MTLRTAGIIAGAVVVAFAAGWCTGASGRSDVAVRLSEAEIRTEVAEVRSAVLAAQVSVSVSNFGDAQRSIERAVMIAQQLQGRLRTTGRADAAGAVGQMITELGEAGRRSAQLDPSAGEAAARALRTLESSVPLSVP